MIPCSNAQFVESRKAQRILRIRDVGPAIIPPLGDLIIFVSADLFRQ